MKSVRFIRKCRIIKNGVVFFDGSDEECLTALLRLKNSAAARPEFSNVSCLKTEYKGYERTLRQ